MHMGILFKIASQHVFRPSQLNLTLSWSTCNTFLFVCMQFQRWGYRCREGLAKTTDCITAVPPPPAAITDFLCYTYSWLEQTVWKSALLCVQQSRSAMCLYVCQCLKKGADLSGSRQLGAALMGLCSCPSAHSKFFLHQVSKFSSYGIHSWKVTHSFHMAIVSAVSCTMQSAVEVGRSTLNCLKALQCTTAYTPPRWHFYSWEEK